MKYLKLFESNVSDFDYVYEETDETSNVYLKLNGETVGEINAENEKDYPTSPRPNAVTIIDAWIKEEYRGKGLYKQMLLFFLTKLKSKRLHSVFRSESAEYAWQSFLKILPPTHAYKQRFHTDENTMEIMVYKKNMAYFVKDWK